MKAYRLRILTKTYEVDNVNEIVDIISNSIGEKFEVKKDWFYTYYMTHKDTLCCELSEDDSQLYLKLILLNADNEEFIVGYTNCPVADTIPPKETIMLRNAAFTNVISSVRAKL